MSNNVPVREGLDYVKIDGKLYVEPITYSFLSYGFNDHFLSSKMFNKFHESVERYILNIPDEALEEFQRSYKQNNSEVLRYDAKFLKWYLYSKCKIKKDGKTYFQIGNTQFLGEFVEDFLKNKNFTFLDSLPVLSNYSKTFKFEQNDTIYWVFSHMFERQYKQFKSFFQVYNKIAEKFEKLEFKFAFIFWNYVLNQEFADDIHKVQKIINEYKLGEKQSVWDFQIDELIERYYPLFCKNKKDLHQYREIMDSLLGIKKLFYSSSLRQKVNERSKSIYLRLMKHMISRSGHCFFHIRRIPIHADIENPILALALVLEKYQYIDNLAVFYELSCEGLEIFTLDEISQAVTRAAKKQGRSSLIEEWNFLKILIHERMQTESPPSIDGKSSNFESNNDL